MFREHDRVILTVDMPDQELQRGDVGTIIHVYRNGEAYEVEFLTLDGNTAAIATVLPVQIRSVSSTDLTHARHIELSA